EPEHDRHRKNGMKQGQKHWHNLSRLLQNPSYEMALMGDSFRLRWRTISLAKRRASVSRASTLCIDSKCAAGVADITSSIIREMSSKPICFSRNAATATSSAALRAMVLAPPPAPAAS